MRTRNRWIRPWSVAVAAGLLAGLVWRRRRQPRGVGGNRWYSLVYRICYRIGFTPWDRGVPAPELVRFVEGPAAPATGRALDIGCGTGVNSTYLAQHSWEVTGVDMVAQALAAARRRASAAGVSCTLVQGDVTRLRELGVGDGFTLLIDVGCYHTLPADRRDAYVDGVSAVAAPNATLLLYGFAHRGCAPMASGVTPDEVRERFRDWELLDATRMTTEELREHLNDNPSAVRIAARFDPWQYQLRRRPQ